MILLPKLYVTAIDELLGSLDSFLIVGAFDDLRWLRDVPVWIEKKDVIFGHDGRSQHSGVMFQCAFPRHIESRGHLKLVPSAN